MIGKSKQLIIAAYSAKGFIEDPNGNHQSFNIFKYKVPVNNGTQEEIKEKVSSMVGKDYVFKKSAYKFRAAKRILQEL